jgi:hypothetical protein
MDNQNIPIFNERTKTMYYTGIGLDLPSDDLLPRITYAAYEARKKGFILRTSLSDGAWVPFWIGSGYGKFMDRIRIKEATALALNMAKSYIAQINRNKWDYFDQHQKNLHALDIMLLFGPQCNHPSKFLLCWTPNGAESAAHCTGLNGVTGYVGFLIQVARVNKIPVINLQRKDWKTKLKKVLAKIEKQRIASSVSSISSLIYQGNSVAST